MDDGTEWLLLELGPAAQAGDYVPVAFMDNKPLDDEAWLGERVGGAAEFTRDTRLASLGLSGQALAAVFLDAMEHLLLAFPEEHTDPERTPARTYGELQDAFKEARRAKDHPHRRSSPNPLAADVSASPPTSPVPSGRG
jgi:hypothetical protein